MRRHRAAALLAVLTTAAWAVDPAQKQGREIYRHGTAAGDPITIYLPGSGVKVPATRFACISCHGSRGEGALEGSVRFPPIHQAALSSNRDGWNRPRTPYTAELVARALTEGLGSNGQPLHRAMPRYQMSPEQLAALMEYLLILNTDKDRDAGITDAAVRIGAMLPLSGSAESIGREVRARIEMVFSRINVAGGIYGRQLDLVTIDSSATDAAAMAALASREPFLLLASFLPGDESEAGRSIRRNAAPVVGPLGFSGEEPAAARSQTFPFLPSFTDEVRILMMYAATSGKWRRAILIHPDAMPAAVIDERWKSALVAHLEYGHQAFAPQAAVACVRENRADAVLFLGSANELQQFTARLRSERLSPAILASLMRLEQTGWPAARGFLRELYLTSPVAEGQLPAAPLVAEAVAETAVEALKRAGRRLTQFGFAQALTAMRNVETGAYGGVALAPALRIRANGAYIVQVENGSGQFSAVTEWMTAVK